MSLVLYSVVKRLINVYSNERRTVQTVCAKHSTQTLVSWRQSVLQHFISQANPNSSNIQTTMMDSCGIAEERMFK